MVTLALASVILLTSLGAYAVGIRYLGLDGSRLRHGVGKTLEWLGLGMVFLFANITLGVAAVLLFRALTRRFISVYVLDDVSLVFLALLQASVFQWWRER
jgi:hypothetical protein